MGDGEKPGGCFFRLRGALWLKYQVVEEVAECAGDLVVVGTLPPGGAEPVDVTVFVGQQQGVCAASDPEAEFNEQDGERGGAGDLDREVGAVDVVGFLGGCFCGFETLLLI